MNAEEDVCSKNELTNEIDVKVNHAGVQLKETQHRDDVINDIDTRRIP